MRQKVSDYIADFLAGAGVTEIFTVPGGLAMHMNDSFGHHPKIHCTYQHHEQACGMAAEAYARYSGKMAGVCVTAGPAATNAVTGVLGCWMSSIPMIVLSGQTRTATSIESTGLPIRCRGIQECEFYDRDASLPDAVGAMAACRWALGRQAQAVEISISGT